MASRGLSSALSPEGKMMDGLRSRPSLVHLPFRVEYMKYIYPIAFSDRIDLGMLA
jgi:hypothetical protein